MKAPEIGEAERYFLISYVSERYGVHPQTLRQYERAGLLTPLRSKGNTRRYSPDDLDRLETILGLTREMGVNLAGVEIILRLREKVAELQRRVMRDQS
jgi:MerR family transcriptional regulator/heat shock protein HspR